MVTTLVANVQWNRLCFVLGGNRSASGCFTGSNIRCVDVVMWRDLWRHRVLSTGMPAES